MRSVGIGRVLQFGILLLLLMAHLPSLARDFEWKDASGNTHNLSELRGILREHRQWVESGKKLGSRAILKSAQLSGVDLYNKQLTDAELGGANLSGAYLSEAHLSGANLIGFARLNHCASACSWHTSSIRISISRRWLKKTVMRLRTVI